jgi:hypothetical protein
MVLVNTKHEHFAQNVAKGLSHADAYVKAGYSTAGAAACASRLLTNANICGRINDLKTAISAGVIHREIRKRSWRVQVLQDRVDGMLALSALRANLYRTAVGEREYREVTNPAEEKQAIEDGFRHEQAFWELAGEVYPKSFVHPGRPNGGATGMLVKDFRGKNAEQEIWKFDGALEARIADDLKQAAIEEGQWTEKREMSGTVGMSEIMQRLNAGRDRVVALKAAREAAAGKVK